MSFEQTKREVAIGNRVLSQVGLCVGVTVSLGHVSLRVEEAPDRFVVKGRGYELDAIPAMRAADMVVCDLDGNLVEGPPGATQCYEVKIHSCIYRRYPEIRSVLHAHPRYTVLMSVLGSPLVPMCNEGSQLVRRMLPVWPHSKLVSTDEDGEEVAALMEGSPAALLLGHGAVTAGASIDQSVLAMVNLEEQARMNYLACCAAGAGHPGIPEELLREAAEAPQYFELPHFQSGPARPGGEQPARPRSPQTGPYRYWASLVEAGV
jgi:ribulose-5-phosphate 4-epimerase/fuculose-1-phosphate aldolase